MGTEKLTYKNQKKGFAALAAGAIAIGMIVTGICFAFVWHIADVTKEETERYLSEISEGIADTIDARLAGILTSLTAIGQSYMEYDASPEEKLKYLANKQRINEFQDLSVVDLDGVSKGVSGRVLDLSGIPGIQQVLNGESTVSSSLVTPIEGMGEFVYDAVPLYDEGSIVGALVAWNTPDTIREMLGDGSFGGEGFSQLIDTNGDFVVLSQNKNAPQNVGNFFSMMEESCEVMEGSTLNQMRSDLKNGKSGYMKFSDGTMVKAMNYVPLRHPGLYIMSVVPEKAASAKFDDLKGDALVINIIIVVLFVLLISCIIAISRRNRKRLEEIAFVDPITGGYSHTRFRMEAEKKIREAEPGTYMMVSLDIRDFKLVNDIFGSGMGDKTLRHLHGILLRRIQKDELLCRVSADHFLLLVKSVSNDKMMRYLNEVSHDLNAFNLECENKYYLTLAVGVYQIDDPLLPLRHIQDRANIARKDKRAATGNFLYSCVFYSDIERQKMLRETDMKNKMDQSLEEGEFQVFLQPKIELEHDTIAGAEALVRWHDKEKGIIPPDEFIPFFERNGFIVKLDLYVFEQVCLLLRKWLDHEATRAKAVPISVNLSRVHLNDAAFLDKFVEIRKKYDIPPELLEIELTETLVFKNLEALIRVIDQIHEAGFQCSLDDFGSGYSSLNTLRDIKVDTLKLDKAFLAAPGANNPRERAIIESVVSMAKKLDMTTVSEGVETMSQLDFLRGIHCNMAQGYVFSKPVPIPDFERMLE